MKNRTFSSIALLVFQAMSSFYVLIPARSMFRIPISSIPPVRMLQGCGQSAGLVRNQLKLLVYNRFILGNLHPSCGALLFSTASGCFNSYNFDYT
jgi:hypothetical protein